MSAIDESRPEAITACEICKVFIAAQPEIKVAINLITDEKLRELFTKVDGYAVMACGLCPG